MTDQDSPQRRIRLRRDEQQWEFDRAIRDTGRVYHFQPPGGGRLPPTVRMHSMISKHIGRNAARLEKLAAAEKAAGHRLTALEFYYDAALAFANAQHPVLVNNDEKKFLHGASIRCYDQVRELAPYPIERLQIPFGDSQVSGNLHLAPVEGPAPLVFFIPGCDMTKEFVPHPLYNWATQRGMHLFCFDGPGQGECNIRDLKLTLTNYEEAAVTALDHLVERPEIDAEQVGLYSQSFGSYWGVRFAASEPRLKAAVFSWASIADKYHLFEEESPRYKQLLAFMTGLPDEDALDDFIAQMGLEDHMGRIDRAEPVHRGGVRPAEPARRGLPAGRSRDRAARDLGARRPAPQRQPPGDQPGGRTGLADGQPLDGVRLDRRSARRSTVGTGRADELARARREQRGRPGDTAEARLAGVTSPSGRRGRLTGACTRRPRRASRRS